MKKYYIIVLVFGFLFASYICAEEEFPRESMCGYKEKPREISLFQAFAIVSKELVKRDAADLVLMGCSELDTTWGLIEKNNYPQYWGDKVNLLFVFFDGAKNGKYLFSILQSDDPFDEAIVDSITGEIKFVDRYN